jgi:F0F1-type ATP synthase membrane subunit c/vacuolar-type H+-ATPase subunit K
MQHGLALGAISHLTAGRGQMGTSSECHHRALSVRNSSPSPSAPPSDMPASASAPRPARCVTTTRALAGIAVAAAGFVALLIIGTIFKGVIESVTRQPEIRDVITQIQWLGFALTEAVFFYGLVAGLIAYVL